MNEQDISRLVESVMGSINSNSDCSGEKHHKCTCLRDITLDMAKKLALKIEAKAREIGVNAVVGAKITESDFVHNEKKSLLKAYLVELEHDGIEKPFVLTEHTEYKWVCIDEIPSYEFVDSDLKIYPKVKEFLSSLKSCQVA